MIWRIVNLVAGKTDDEKSGSKKKKKTVEKFSLEFCKLEAKIMPDGECLIQHVSCEDIIFKSSQVLKEGEQVSLQIIYYPLKGQFEDFESLQTPLKIVKKGQITSNSFLYKSEYVNSNDPKLKAFFKYLQHIEALQLEQKVDYKDRRAYFRVNRVLPVFSKHIKQHKGLTRNISRGGIMLACSGGVKKGDVIRFRLELDDYSVDALQLDGEVCWVDESNFSQVLVGIRFVNVSEDQGRIIHNYVESIKKNMGE